MSLYHFLFLSPLSERATLYSTMLTKDDLKNIRVIMREEIDTLETKMELRFDKQTSKWNKIEKTGHNFSMILESFLIN
jgi:hypothetical protein